jgi:hypothetical protein
VPPPASLDLWPAIQQVASSDTVRAAMLMGAAIETGQINQPFPDQYGGGPGRGPFQIEAGPGGSHTGEISEDDARNPLTAAQFMVGEYTRAVGNTDAAGLSYPQYLATVAYRAERPAVMYPQDRIDRAWTLVQPVVKGGPIETPTWVTGEQVIAADMIYLGKATFVDEGSTVPSYYRCEEFIEVGEENCGLGRLRYADANADCDAFPLNQGLAPIGSRVFFKGQGWSQYGHVGHSLGDGRTISALTVVTITDGWQNPAVGYQGWRYAPGVGPATPTKEDVDMHVDGKFDAGRERRLWDGPKSKAAIKSVGSIDLNRGIDSRWEEELHAGRPLGYATSKEEPMATGGVIRYFSNGFICSYPDGSTTVC